MVIFDYHAFQLIFIRPSFIYANITTWLNEKIEKKISLSEVNSIHRGRALWRLWRIE